MLVSVLFSEPKIPQSISPPPPATAFYVSVLFSEPKIPQIDAKYRYLAQIARFSALQRAENSSNVKEVQNAGTGLAVSVLFSEPKIPQTE